ncbi:MAG TPA: hypothetical protein DET40_20095 [Lentisphaeria bacterium]|nr:MAG: hypothetical protein A2X45_24105 [Lentisphaerae bacterium GWF2_50_93]HCE45853.1 hypothetical protein [Lentisphaeria bacterium]
MLGYCQTCRKHVELAADPASGKQNCIYCGNTIALPSVSHLNSGTVINGFLIESKLGQGGMGVVYKAKQLNLERYVALKVLSDELSRDTEFVERFFKEARSAASLSHSNIVQVYDAGSTLDGIYYFAMELIEGETLDTRISRDGLLPPKDALDIASKIASALDYAWERQKLCHGDIKPDNIILNSSGGAKLADLGLAKSIHDEKKDTKEGLMATPLYAPPEVIAGDVHRIDCRSDMYSFGATLYHMLAGIPPFMANDAEAVMKKHLNDKHVPLVEISKEINPSISNIVDHLLAKNPEKRPSSWKEICKTLDKIHDIERKVFHKPVGAAKPNAPAVHPHEEKAPPDPILRLITTLVAAVIVLAILAIAIFFYLESKKSSGGGSGKSTATTHPAPQPQLTHAQIISNEWQKLKSDIDRVDPEYGINLIQNYVKKYPANVPDDADKLLQGLKGKLVAQQNAKDEMQKKLADMRKETADLCGILKAMVFSKEKKQVLEDASKRIENLLQYANKNKDFEISVDDKNSLNHGFLMISDALQKIKQEEERVIREEEAKKERERLDLEKKKLAEEEKLRQDKLAQNNLVDGYYLALGDFEAYYLKKKDAAYLKELLDAWLEENKKVAIPESFISKSNFIKGTVVSSEAGLFGVFERNEAFLRGKPFPGLLTGFDVDRVTEKTFKMMTSMEKGKMGKTIQWDSLTSENINQLLLQRILKPDSGVKLTKQDVASILTFFLFNHMGAQFADLVKSFNGFTPQEKKGWEAVSEDFKRAQDERKAIDLWREFSGLMKTGRAQDASQVLIELNNGYKNTDLYKRYSDEISRQMKLLMSFLPDLQAMMFLEGAAKDLKNNNFIAALEKAMTANSRCGNMKNLNQSIRDQIKSIQGQCLAALASASPIKNIADNRIPFYYWESETPGDAWIYEQVVRNSGKINNQELLSTMSIGSSIDTGNWAQAFQIMNASKHMGADKLIAGVKGNLLFWVPSFIFAQGAVYMNYGDWESQSSILSGLQAMAEQFKQTPMGPMDTLTSNLAIEYALMLHQPVKANDIAAAYQYSMQRPDREVRIALLHMLTFLERSDVGRDEYHKALKKYGEQFKQFPELSNDFNWCRMAAWLLDDTRTLDPKRLQFLKEARCVAPDICARIMTAALARAYAVGSGFSSEKELYPLIEERISGNTVSGELWRQLAILRIARAHSPVAMLRQVNESLNDYRFCSIAFYPKLSLLKNALEVNSGKLTAKEAEKRQKYILESSNISSDADKLCADAMISPVPSELLAKLVSENKFADAYWCGIAGILTHPKDMKQRGEILRIFSENDRFLTWDERLLLKVLSD